MGDALESPGELDYSPEARARFGLLAAELRRLRSAVGEPILDLVRRIIDTCGIDVELASSASPAAAARRDNLDLFVQAVSEFQAVDGQVTLAALLAWLEAEDAYGQGLDVATPSEADSVKLLTVHRAKGLEWDVVFIPGVTERKFPTDRTRSTWLTVPFVMPGRLRGDARDRPALAGHTPADIAAFTAATKEHERIEELRLAYVAWTRARHRLRVTGWCFSPKIKAGRGPSTYLEATVRALAARGVRARAVARPAHQGRRPTPTPHSTPTCRGRCRTRPPEVARAARRGRARRRRGRGAGGRCPVGRPHRRRARAGPDPGVGRTSWPGWSRRRAATASPVIDVPLPSSLSATALARLRDTPDSFAADLARPMPRQPSPAARFGTRFHAWVESRFGQQDLFDPDDLPGRGDAGIDDDADLQDLIDDLRGAAPSPTASPTPSRRRSRWCSVVRWCAAGSTRCTPSPGRTVTTGWSSTGRPTGSPTPIRGSSPSTGWPGPSCVACPSSGVRAQFYYVRTGTVVEPADLPGRADLERVFARG